MESQCYHNQSEVFNKSKASSLPLHREFDSKDSLPGAPIPNGPRDSLSAQERKMVEDYLKNSVQAGIFHPTAGAALFFVEKDKTLRPCID